MRILLIEDDAIMQLQFGDFLKKFGKVTIAESRIEAEKILQNQYFEIGFFDLDLGEDKLAGLDLLQLAKSKIKRRFLLTSHDDDTIIERAFSLKATGFFSKNAEYKQLRKEIEFVLIQSNWDQHQKTFYQDFPTQNTFLKDQINLLINNPSLFSLNLFLTGETGTGKTYLVKQICKILFPNKKLFNLNLSEIPRNLLESELFGHVEGSFTGASKNRIGLLEEAHNQIIFLDEITTLPIEVQGRLLKVLEEKRFRPVGSNKEIESEFLLITATCEDVQEKIKAKTFREDLYYRLRGHHLQLPSLKQRKEDIPLIAKAWMKQSPKKVLLTKTFIESLCQRRWPGNTRELIHYLKQFCYLGQTKIQKEFDEPAISPNEDIELEVKNQGLQKYLSQLERQIFRQFAEKYDYKVNKICRELKLSKAVYYRLARG